MKIVFLGSGAFAIPSLEALLGAGHQVAAVVTQPDKEKGRGRALAPPPVKPVALAHGLTVLQPRRVKEPAAQDAIRALAPEIQVVVAYGQILPTSVIEIPPRRTVNVHGSLLPRYRGAAPVQWAIVNGETETGVTTMLIDAGLDTGPVLLARSTPIGEEETAEQLERRLAVLGAELLVDTLNGLVDGSVTPTPQDHERATHAPIIRKEDGVIDWSRPADAIERKVRGFHAWPGATTALAGRGLKVLRARVLPGSPADAPGTLVHADRDGLVVACGDATRLLLLEVQPESRNAMPSGAFAAGARLAPGVRLG
ncbi:MAG TPA: methionyl-tRNA formyltransferase [Vicinamibacteria bacterium]|nr:methionyl-tRNA formyltransferase [Vicinamibacteria bacterium]